MKVTRKPLKFIAYLRVSTQRQAEGNGFKNQRNDILDFLKSSQLLSNPKQVKFYREKPCSGRSGTAAIRPVLKKAVRAARESGANGVFVVADISRIARNYKDTQKVLRALDKSGCQIICVKQELNSLDTGPSAYNEAARHAEQRHRELSRQGKSAAQRCKASNGHWGAVPFGYRKRNDRSIERDPVTWPVVRRIVVLSRRGRTAYAIAKLLNQEGIRTQRGKRWHERTVKNVIERNRSKIPPAPKWCSSVKRVRKN